jgi:hypothetical protein
MLNHTKNNSRKFALLAKIRGQRLDIFSVLSAPSLLALRLIPSTYFYI